MIPKPAEIRAARERLKLTQTEAAALLGFGRDIWARYESGSRAMPAHVWAYWKHVAGLERIPFRKAPCK